jgi:hypothetical protein
MPIKVFWGGETRGLFGEYADGATRPEVLRPSPGKSLEEAIWQGRGFR